MLSNLLACVIAGQTPVASCCALDGDAGQTTHLLVASGNALSLWGSVEGVPTQLRSWPLPGPALHVELISATETGGGSWRAAPEGSSPAAAVAAHNKAAPTSAKCQRPLLLAVIQGAGACEVLLLRAGSAELEVVDRAPLAAEGLPHVELAAPRFSGLCAGHPPAHRTVMVCAAVESCLHVVSVNHTLGRAPSLEVGCHKLCELLDQEDGASVAVEALALGPSSSLIASGGLVGLAAHSYPLGGGPPLRCAAALSLGTHSHLSIGPWFLRNVDPTTTVVHPVLAAFDHADASAPPSAAMLLLSARSAWLLQSDGPGRRKLEMALDGAPTAAATLRGGGTAAAATAAPSLVLVADAAGSLRLLDCGLAGAHVRISASAPLPVASRLAHLPHWLDRGSDAVFVGSSASGESAILEVPADPLDPAAVWAVEGALLPSLAPVQHAQLIPDPAGGGGARLLCCCGDAPRGRLALAGLAAVLQPLAEGQRLPGQVHLLPLAPAPGAARDSHLLLSVGKEGGGGATLVLAAEGGSFAEASLPGLQTDMATLLVAPMPAGCLLQVTPREARMVRPAGGGALVSHWEAGDAAITLAAAHGQYLLLATGLDLHLLWVSSATAKLQQERRLSLPQQASSLALFELAANGGAPELWLAAGVWLTNQVLIYQPGSDEPAAAVSLGAHQPRSLLVAELGGSARLLVGTATGELLCWALAAARRRNFGPAELRLVPDCWVRVGAASVDLQLLPAPGAGGPSGASSPRRSGAPAGPRVLARADQALLLEAHPLLPGRLQAARLHGGAGLAAAVPLRADALPPGSLAWVAPGGRLTLGRLDGAPALRWDQVQLGATPALAAFHAGSGCAAVACGADPGGGAGSSLRLVDLRATAAGSSGAVVGRVDLAPGHVVSAVASLVLPCSGGRGSDGGERPGRKELLLVASYLEGAPAAAEAAQAREQAPLRCEGGEPWWRRPAAFPEAPLQGRDGTASGDDEPSGVASVVGDVTSVAAAATAAQPAESLALMSVFEVQRQAFSEASPTAAPARACNANGGATAATASSSGQPFRLVLHGTMPLPAACYCLAAVEPAAAALDSPGHGTSHPGPPGTSAARQEQEQGPLLLAGCQDGLRLFRIYVDDDAVRESTWALERSLAAVAVVDPLQLDADESAPPPAGAGAPTAAVDGGRRGGGGCGEQPLEEAAAAGRLWHQRVAMQLLSSSPMHDRGIVANLSVRGSTVFASGLTGGLTVFSVRPPAPGLLPALVPCAADADRLDWRLQAPALGLSDWLALAPLDDRLVLLNRSLEAEQRQRELVALRAERAGQPPRLFSGPGVEDVADLELAAASCRLQQSCGGGLAALAEGCLGVRVCPLEDFLERTGGSCSGADGLGSTSAVFVARDGNVGAVACLAEEDAQAVSRLQLLLARENGQAQDPGFRGLLTLEAQRLAEACLRDESGLRAEMRRVGAAEDDLRRCRDILLNMCPTACWPTVQ